MEKTVTSNARGIAGVYRGNGFHWVGDGFRVTNLFPSGNDLGARLSPFLLMDYHAPHTYAATDSPRGVGAHPHRGFETVTVAFEGSLAHHDSNGGGGVIGPGDVQWMTAAAGILHKEYHEADWAARGGTMHMMQLWVNLPAAHKMDPPRYQPLVAADMGSVDLPGAGGTVRVIAGEYRGVPGPAKTFTDINLWDIALNPGGQAEMTFPSTENTALFVLEGTITANGTPASAGELILFANEGQAVAVGSATGGRTLLLNGEPIDEPVVSYGPFVMNTPDEIVQAVEDFNAGMFGHLA